MPSSSILTIRWDDAIIFHSLSLVCVCVCVFLVPLSSLSRFCINTIITLTKGRMGGVTRSCPVEMLECVLPGMRLIRVGWSHDKPRLYTPNRTLSLLEASTWPSTPLSICQSEQFLPLNKKQNPGGSLFILVIALWKSCVSGLPLCRSNLGGEAVNKIFLYCRTRIHSPLSSSSMAVLEVHHGAKTAGSLYPPK